ncbi:TPA: class I SAM-dependent methyltransferase [Bacillus cereus]|uniref:Methyltransferase small domain protein n=2 Tax=Bacillus cereus TaxID=1396 RepID=A0AAN0SU90_BACCE|nr:MULTISPECIES: class I SAM-dependent methyltransferase [Bacillus cereus group]ABK85462.1 SAM-dependent methyltransferase [Bacillus thuringiensis str. Al Hakam]ACO26235.1 SAM-dependent methyltransferase [Bacillus cereus 03BB102]AEW55531.1 SAM-dependent methyltransferase YrrT like protein [Bacillus cereus F837/76]AJG55291.1 methyltransferase domain protein [Bacillus cereus 03BB102]AJG61072.1 methyltransferase domain protein [Bacillus cereus D17]
MLRTVEATQKLFDEWAKTYDENLQEATGPLYGYSNSLIEAKEMIQLYKRGKIIDIGIGTGTFASLMRENNESVVGVDVSERMLETCKEKYPTFHLEVGSFTNTNQEDEAFDIVISSFCFHEVLPSERKKACEEVYRIVRKEGKFLLLDIMFVSDFALNEARERIGKKWDSTEVYPLVNELDTLLRETGFSSVNWRQTAPCHWALVAHK